MVELKLSDSQREVMHDYCIRESLKAKHVSLKMSVQGGLEVIIPQGFDQSRIPEILKDKQNWIEKTIQRLEEQREKLALEVSHALPQDIFLRAINQHWQVEYQPYQTARASLVEYQTHLELRGNVEQRETCQSLLQRWLARKACQTLVPWLESVSQTIELPFQRAGIRGQKTLWASCSQQRSISLNYKLLFLPADLVHYVFVHELCHTVHLNHSPQFWALVAAKNPGYRSLDQELRRSSNYVPGWLEPSGL